LSPPIVEILEIHEQGGFRFDGIFGATRRTITKQLKRKFDDIDDIDKQEKYYEYVDKKIDKVEKKTTADYTPLWTGTVYLMDIHTIRPTKKLSDCTTGWVLQWQRYESGEGKLNNNFQHTF